VQGCVCVCVWGGGGIAAAGPQVSCSVWCYFGQNPVLPPAARHGQPSLSCLTALCPGRVGSNGVSNGGASEGATP
jgi:hypothetical protein